jgi:hypothetical protein
MAYSEKQVTRSDILVAINLYRPFGRGVGTDDLIVVTSLEYKAVRSGSRISVISKRGGDTLYLGGKKQSNWHFMQWIKSHSDGRGLVARGLGIPTISDAFIVDQD